MITLNFHVTKAEWLNNPNGRWNNGLKRAGANWIGGLKRYPPKPPRSTYVRTGTLRKKANFLIVEEGKQMDVGTVSYGRPVLLNSEKRARNWIGKLNEVIEAMKRGFAKGIQENKE